MSWSLFRLLWLVRVRVPSWLPLYTLCVPALAFHGPPASHPLLSPPLCLHLGPLLTSVCMATSCMEQGLDQSISDLRNLLSASGWLWTGSPLTILSIGRLFKIPRLLLVVLLGSLVRLPAVGFLVQAPFLPMFPWLLPFLLVLSIALICVTAWLHHVLFLSWREPAERCWAQAVLQGQVARLRSVCGPLAISCSVAIGWIRLQGSPPKRTDSVCHSFASICEAKVYCAAAGFPIASLQQQWIRRILDSMERPGPICVLRWPISEDPSSSTPVLCVPVLQRVGGLFVELPSKVLDGVVAACLGLPDCIGPYLVVRAAGQAHVLLCTRGASRPGSGRGLQRPILRRRRHIRL